MPENFEQLDQKTDSAVKELCSEKFLNASQFKEKFKLTKVEIKKTYEDLASKEGNPVLKEELKKIYEEGIAKLNKIRDFYMGKFDRKMNKCINDLLSNTAKNELITISEYIKKYNKFDLSHEEKSELSTYFAEFKNWKDYYDLTSDEIKQENAETVVLIQKLSLSFKEIYWQLYQLDYSPDYAEKLIDLNLDNAELRELILNTAYKPLRYRLEKKMFTQNPDSEDLSILVDSDSKSIANKAEKPLIEIMTKNPDKTCLIAVIRKCPREYAEKAWYMLVFQFDPNIDDLMMVVSGQRRPFNKQAAEMVVNNNPDKNVLFMLLMNTEENHFGYILKSKIAEALLTYDLNNNEITSVNCYISPDKIAEYALLRNKEESYKSVIQIYGINKSYIDELAIRLIKKSGDDKEVFYTIFNSDCDQKIKDEIAKKLLEGNPEMAELFLLLRKSSYKEIVWKKLLGTNPTYKDFNDRLFYFTFRLGENNDEYVKKSLSYIVSHTDNKDDLRGIFGLADESLQDTIFEKIKEDPSSYFQLIMNAVSDKLRNKIGETYLNSHLGYSPHIVLLVIIEHCSGDVKNRAEIKFGEIINKKENGLDADKLIGALDLCKKDELKNEIGQKLLANNPDSKALLIIIEKCTGAVKQEAINVFLKTEKDNSVLVKILRVSDDKTRNAVADIVLKRNPSNFEIMNIWLYCPSYRDKVFGLIKPDIEDEHFREFILMSSGDADLQRKLLRKIPKDKIPEYIMPGLKMSVWAPEDMRDIFGKLTAKRVTEDYDKFEDLYFMPVMQNYFRANADKLTYANSFSIALTVLRYIDKNAGGIINDANINKALDKITRSRDKFANFELINKDTTLIHFTHEDDVFSNDGIGQFAKDSNVGRIENNDLKGPESKDKVLQLIAGSKGKTTVWFNGHGGPMVLGLGMKPKEIERSNIQINKWTITYQEMGNALIRSGNVRNITIIIDACYSYDYSVHLFNYLKNPNPPLKGIDKVPVIVTETNKGSLGWGGGSFGEDSGDLKGSGSLFLDSIIMNHRINTPLTGSVLYDAEGARYLTTGEPGQDPAMFFLDENDKTLEIGAVDKDKTQMAA